MGASDPSASPFLLHLGESLARDAEGIDARRDAALDRDLQEHLEDLGPRQAVAQRSLDVDLELVRAIEGAQHGEVEEAAGLLRELLAAPDRAPAIFGDQLLHRQIEIVGSRKGLLDELLAEDRLADLQ